MVLRKNNSNTISIENSQDKSLITVKTLDGQLLVKVQSGSKEIEITKPGDYEYFEDSITGFEIPVEKYTGVINLLKTNVEGIRVVFITQFREIPKEVLSNLANIDILVMPIVNPTSTKNTVNTVEPKKVVALKNFNGGEEVELDSVIKSIGLTSMAEVPSVKHKFGDFASTSEDFLLTGEILS